MLEHFFKSLVATVSDPYQCNRITDALAAAGIKFYCKSKDVNRHNTFDQVRIGTLGMPNCFLVLADTRYCHFCGRMGRSAMLHLTYLAS